ncbi:isoleucine--tRNA ligase [Malassezia caprae]|uniref:isoleucine--tRNA ligase n=1 Tax=Malassezia caprae TaxID=1381934 RepID=A0AAF0E3F4_9BASI|nr:isoleucine--tRNA ligase [Malassezia caprae]
MHAACAKGTGAARCFHAAARACAKARPYQSTLRLPQTAFQLRASAKDRECLFRPATTERLYLWQREHLARDGVRDFVLHDGPPYANGRLHMGHALNKILKDVIVRFHVLQGRRVHFMPGWDCHGLPIEIKAVAEAADAGQTSLSPSEIRRAARAVALREIQGQRAEFQELGLLASWADEHTYRTLSFAYEREQLRIFARAVERGLIYEHFRPVYWSPSTQTALAEAEIEYDERHVSRSAYVRLRLVPSEALAAHLHDISVDLLVWTTTPWSLLGNMAVAVQAEASYSVVRTADSEHMIVATELLPELERLVRTQNGAPLAPIGAVTELVRVPGSALVGCHYTSPLMAPGEQREILHGAFVTTASGTGLVHMAPAHGQEDYALWRDTGRLATHGMVSPVDAQGRLLVDRAWGATEAVREDLARLHEQPAITQGTDAIIDLLERHGVLLAEHKYEHSYPIDWRTKQPILTRATSQWFADLRQTLDDTQAALQAVQFVPPAGAQRLHSLVARRSEWCISRQRAWGVPIPVVYDAVTHEPLITARNVEHILRVMDAHGSADVWWERGAEEFVAPEYRAPGRTWYKKGDTLDVWFDSGSSWAVLQAALGEPWCAPHACADVYLEGSDQHRGWFQSSMLTRAAACGPGVVAPYAALVTHGFVVDEAGRKMSKSLGNVLAPSAFLHGDPAAPKEFPALGADVLRWWAAKADYTRDMPVSALIMKHVSDEVRKLRTTVRFLLANLSDTPAHAVPPLHVPKASLMERFTMHELHRLERTCRAAYGAFDLALVTRSLLECATKTLSSLYLAVSKDTLYAGSNADRQPVLYVLDQALQTLTSVLAPILPHLAEEIMWYRSGATADPTPAEQASMPSMFQRGWHTIDDAWHDPGLEHDMHHVLRVRSDIFSLMTQCIEQHTRAV